MFEFRILLCLVFLSLRFIVLWIYVSEVLLVINVACKNGLKAFNNTEIYSSTLKTYHYEKKVNITGMVYSYYV